MLKLTGVLEVFKNKNGYITGVIKAWDDNKALLGKTYLSVSLPKDVTVEEGQTLTLDIKEAYLNAVYIGTDAPFTKLEINVVKCDIKSVFPEAKIKKSSKQVAKKVKPAKAGEDLPF